MKTPPRSLRHALALACGLASLAAAPAHAATIYGLAADRQVSASGSVSDVNPMLTGYSGTNALNAVFVFQLPTLPAGKAFANVSARIYHQGKTGSPNYNADLYGLGASASSTVNPGDLYAGPLDGSTLLLHDNFLTPSAGSGGKTTSAAVLTDYLNLAYAGGSGAGHHVFLRLSPDVAGLNNYTRYNVYSAETTLGTFYKPSITYDVVDAPPAWLSVPLGGGGYVTGIISDPTGADIYIRTDVGGAFRWVESAGAWVSITDEIVPTTTTGGSGLMNVASIALDPSDSDKLYVAAGRPGSSALRGIYASGDRGATWTAIETTIAMDGNGGFRSFGERLAVDPNNSNILWFGSHSEGLWKGVKSGSTWTWSQIPAGSVPHGQVPSGNDKAGVVFVATDANAGSTITYAGVYDSVGSTGGVYRSTNGGSTWSKVSGATLARPARGQVAPDGTLYVTANGVVAKMPRGGSFSAITPVSGVNYRAVATDPNDSTGDTLYVAEANGSAQYNKIWRSTDGGSTWAQQHQNLNDNRTIERAEPDGTPTITGYWFGNITSLLVNPADSDELWAADFFGVARTQNADQLGGSGIGNQAVWHMLQKNQEETVVEALRNAPAGPALLTGVADVNGYRYDDLGERPQGAGGNAFSNPSGANTTSLDFSEGEPDVWVRAWTGTTSSGGSSYYGGGATSLDAGLSWLAFGEIDRRVVSRGPAGWEEWDLTTYLAAQQARGVGVVTLLLATGANTTQSAAVLSFDSREATDSSLRPRIVVNGSTTLNPTADATVAGGTPTTALGTATTLGTSYSWGTIAQERYIYLKFDLSTAPTITSAALRLHRVTAPSGLDYPVGAYGSANTTWTEGGITWNNRPSPYASSSGRPTREHRYRTAAGLNLSGGRASVSATDPARMVWMPFGTSTVPHYSDDRGVVWRPASGLPANVNRLAGKSNPSYNMIQLASDRVNGHFYIAHFSAGGGAHHIYRSTDGGANWSHTGTIAHTGGSYSHYRNQIVAAPVAGHVWVSDDGGSGTANGGLWKSTDGAVNWSPRLANIRAVRQVAFGKPPSGSSYDYTVYFNGYYNGVKGVYQSDDYGATWTALPDLPTNADIESLAGDRQIHGGVFIGTSGRGVFQYQP